MDGPRRKVTGRIDLANSSDVGGGGRVLKAKVNPNAFVGGSTGAAMGGNYPGGVSLPSSPNFSGAFLPGGSGSAASSPGPGAAGLRHGDFSGMPNGPTAAAISSSGNVGYGPGGRLPASSNKSQVGMVKARAANWTGLEDGSGGLVRANSSSATTSPIYNRAGMMISPNGSGSPHAIATSSRPIRVAKTSSGGGSSLSGASALSGGRRVPTPIRPPSPSGAGGERHAGIPSPPSSSSSASGFSRDHSPTSPIVRSSSPARGRPASAMGLVDGQMQSRQANLHPRSPSPASLSSHSTSTSASHSITSSSLSQPHSAGAQPPNGHSHTPSTGGRPIRIPQPLSAASISLSSTDPLSSPVHNHQLMPSPISPSSTPVPPGHGYSRSVHLPSSPYHQTPPQYHHLGPPPLPMPTPETPPLKSSPAPMMKPHSLAALFQQNQGNESTGTPGLGLKHVRSQSFGSQSSAHSQSRNAGGAKFNPLGGTGAGWFGSAPGGLRRGTKKGAGVVDPSSTPEPSQGRLDGVDDEDEEDAWVCALCGREMEGDEISKDLDAAGKVHARRGTRASIDTASSSPQAPQKTEEEIEEEKLAKGNRKILDLEISNSSLLAINAALERSKRKQQSEIRDLRRKVRDAAQGAAPYLLSPEEESGDEHQHQPHQEGEEEVEDDNKPWEEIMNEDEKFRAVCGVLDSLVKSGKEALDAPKNLADWSGREGTKVINLEYDEDDDWNERRRPGGDWSKETDGFGDEDDEDQTMIHHSQGSDGCEVTAMLPSISLSRPSSPAPTFRRRASGSLLPPGHSDGEIEANGISSKKPIETKQTDRVSTPKSPATKKPSTTPKSKTFSDSRSKTLNRTTSSNTIGAPSNIPSRTSSPSSRATTLRGKTPSATARAAIAGSSAKAERPISKSFSGGSRPNSPLKKGGAPPPSPTRANRAATGSR